MIDFKNYLTVAAKKGDHIILEADGLDIYNNYYVEGSEESELLKVVVDETMGLSRKLDSIKIDINHQRSAKDSKGLYNSFETQKELYANYNDFSIRFINEHPSTIAAYFVVIGLQIEENAEEYTKVTEHLNKAHPKFNFLPSLNERTSFLKKALTEGPAPELNYPTPEGDSISLSSLKGKYVLVDFWASWCKPCRMENPFILKMYNKYKDSGFQIYGYSLDQKHESWVEAIKQDGLPWIQTSDLKGWKAQGAFDYGVQSIPSTFLVNPDGYIISKEAKGEELERLLKDIYGF